MNNPVQTDLVLLNSITVNSTCVLLVFSGECELPDMVSGQFAQLSVPASAGVLLRRPVSIHDFSKDNNTVSFLVQQVGRGSEALAMMHPGETVNALLPLGHGFNTEESAGKSHLLIGGGVGMAPLFLLGKELKTKGCDFQFLFGGRSAEHILRLEQYEKLATVNVSTEDGTLGSKGLVTCNPVLGIRHFDSFYCCGPTPMMKAVASIAKSSGISCQVSLEHHMACGIGACLCCVEDTVEGNLCVCKEGPVFDINRLKWQN